MIARYDKWGCDISTKHRVPVHQYDCFITDWPACPDGKTVFHTECVETWLRQSTGAFSTRSGISLPKRRQFEAHRAQD
jgi:hypothetical protein